MTNTVPKRVAAVAAAFLLIALTACSIPSVRAAATKFIRETFDSYVHFFTEKSERRQITEYYRLTELPDGYAEEIVVKMTPVVFPSIKMRREIGSSLRKA